MSLQKQIRIAQTVRILCTAIPGLLACSLLLGCMVAGYSSHGGTFLWPGGLGVVLILMVLLWFLLRRRN